MNNSAGGETPTDKPKFHVTVHPAKDGLVRLDFRRLSRPGIPFSTTVPESQVEAEIQRYHEWVERDDEHQQEIGRRLYGDK